jgi:hypothetical protein
MGVQGAAAVTDFRLPFAVQISNEPQRSQTNRKGAKDAKNKSSRPLRLCGSFNGIPADMVLVGLERPWYAKKSISDFEFRISVKGRK